MKIGILTFHWATNYGAILQAFALQTYLKKMGHEVYIINYRPESYKKSLLKCFLTYRFWLYKNNLREYLKERRLISFREQYLNETILYESLDELKLNPPLFDVYICGSDQIWNPHFTEQGEGKTTLTYFLDFGSDGIKRISYAASFGCTVYPKNLMNLIKPQLLKFDAISVRETSGKDILEQAGLINVEVIADPTLLLNKAEYRECFNNKISNGKKVFIYTLHNNQEVIQKTKRYLKHNLKYTTVDSRTCKHSMAGISGWLSNINDADFVITNSFHGTIFAIIFNKQFITIPVEGKSNGMNDRILTLLDSLNLRNHILEEFDKTKIDQITQHNIDWSLIDRKIEILQNKAQHFIQENI